jgi:sulfate permease, SulP family
MLRGYQRSWLRGDLIAGVTVAAYLVPQVMAYATVAGLPPVAGLWAALPALVIYAMLGSSPSLSMGPEATTALMTAIAITPLAAGDPARYADLATTLALLVGLMSVGAGPAAAGLRGGPAGTAPPRTTSTTRSPASPAPIATGNGALWTP